MTPTDCAERDARAVASASIDGARLHAGAVAPHLLEEGLAWDQDPGARGEVTEQRRFLTREPDAVTTPHDCVAREIDRARRQRQGHGRL